MTLKVAAIPDCINGIIILFIVPIIFSKASETSICSRDVLKNDSSIQYCVQPIPTNRSWYKAMAECRFFGGELVSLEWPEKILDIQKQLKNYAVNMSRALFVNAHKPFYSGNNQFAWKTGGTLDLNKDSNLMEECV